jgi:hypothetical protein
MMADSLGMIAVVIAIVQNGVIYALVGSSIWLLTGPVSVGTRLRPSSQRPGGTGTGGALWKLAALSLTLAPLILLILYAGELVTKLVCLIASAIAIALVWRRGVFPFVHPVTNRRYAPVGACEPYPRALRTWTVAIVGAGWVGLQTCMGYIGWSHRWGSGVPVFPTTGWIVIIPLAAVACLSLAGTTAILSLSVRLVTLWRRGNPDSSSL